MLCLSKWREKREWSLKEKPRGEMCPKTKPLEGEIDTKNPQLTACSL